MGKWAQEKVIKFHLSMFIDKLLLKINAKNKYKKIVAHNTLVTK